MNMVLGFWKVSCKFLPPSPWLLVSERYCLVHWLAMGQAFVTTCQINPRCQMYNGIMDEKLQCLQRFWQRVKVARSHLTINDLPDKTIAGSVHTQTAQGCILCAKSLFSTNLCYEPSSSNFSVEREKFSKQLSKLLLEVSLTDWVSMALRWPL